MSCLQDRLCSDEAKTYAYYVNFHHQYICRVSSVNNRVKMQIRTQRIAPTGTTAILRSSGKEK